jgi:hypothetical protein
MIRHGYVSCTTCHLSPSGGGILTNYGQSLANELLTHHWSNDTSSSESKTQNPEAEETVSKWLGGGNARVLFFHRNNEYENSYVTIPMQLEAYGAYNKEKYAFVLGAAATGRRSTSDSATSGFVLSNAYGLYRFTDEINIRAGQFLPNYGLNNSQHTIATRSPLGFGFKDQRPGAEVSYISDSWGFFLSQFGDRGPHLGENSTTAQVQFSPTKDSRFAVNYWTETNLRQLYGIWFVTPIYKDFYIDADYDIQKETKFDTNGIYYYVKLGYEFAQGLHAYLVKDFSQRDQDSNYTKVDRYGPGFQMFPFLHWEVDSVWLKEKNLTYSKKEADYAYIMAHYYL